MKNFNIKYFNSLMVIPLLLFSFVSMAQTTIFPPQACNCPLEPLVANLDCAAATHNGVLTVGIPTPAGVNSVITYTGGNGVPHPGQTITSTGVTGLTATLSAGTFTASTGTLTYNITGTPSGLGTATFAINIGGQSCNLTRDVVAAIVIPTTITLAQNRMYFVASIIDADYLPYQAPTTAATTDINVTADGIAEPTTIDIQGTITTTGVNVQIPVTTTGSGTLPAFSTTINIPAEFTEDGIARDLTLTWASQAYTTATKFITATIAAVGGTLNAKKLDINAGIGNDALGVLMGTFNYPYNNAGATTTYQVRDIAGIPDKMFGVTDNTGSSTTHNLLYLPTQAEDGNIWLNNNLGAYYSNVNHPSFNLAQQATSATDFRAYGSLFQWGRKPDGHELVNYTSATSGTPRPHVSTRVNEPTHASLIFTGTSQTEWRVNQNQTLWQNGTTANNPCPNGFRVPSAAEYTNLFTTLNITNLATAYSNTILRFTAAGLWNSALGNPATVQSAGIAGRYHANGYWNSALSATRYFDSTTTSVTGSAPANGQSVRCIRN